MDTFWNMNEDDNDKGDDEAYDDEEEEADLFEEGEEQQSTPPIPFNLHRCCFHVKNKWVTCPSSQMVDGQ